MRCRMNIGEIFGTMMGKVEVLAGLDIGTTTIKFVELEGTTPQNMRLVRYAVESLPKDLISSEDATVNMEQMAEAVRRCWKKSGSSLKTVAVALPPSSVITKRVTMPRSDREDELITQVEAEANQYIPFPIDEINLDFQVLGASSADETDDDVLIVAARKDKVDERLAVVEAAGLKVAVMDVESYALANALRALVLDENLHKSVALFDIGAQAGHMYVIKDGDIVHTRDLPVGGMALTNELSSSIGMPYLEVDHAIRNGTLSEDQINLYVRPFVSNLAAECIRAAQLYLGSGAKINLDSILLSGGASSLSGLAEEIQLSLKIPVLLARPLSSGGRSEKVSLNRFTKDEPSLMVATGLAMRRIIK